MSGMLSNRTINAAVSAAQLVLPPPVGGSSTVGPAVGGLSAGLLPSGGSSGAGSSGAGTGAATKSVAGVEAAVGAFEGLTGVNLPGKPTAAREGGRLLGSLGKAMAENIMTEAEAAAKAREKDDAERHKVEEADKKAKAEQEASAKAQAETRRVEKERDEANRQRDAAVAKEHEFERRLFIATGVTNPRDLPSNS